MSEQEGTIRVNISVPRKLKAEMESLSDPPNWSAIACEAFRAHLLDLASQREAMTMEDVIARMKAADALERNESYQTGRETGECWAKNRATPKQLRNLAGDPGEGAPILGSMVHGEIATTLWQEIHPRRETDSHTINCFWEEAAGDNGVESIEDQDFARGWMEGALAIWEKVKDKL
jgi:hypothetical protein